MRIGAASGVAFDVQVIDEATPTDTELRCTDRPYPAEPDAKSAGSACISTTIASNQPARRAWHPAMTFRCRGVDLALRVGLRRVIVSGIRIPLFESSVPAADRIHYPHAMRSKS